MASSAKRGPVHDVDAVDLDAFALAEDLSPAGDGAWHSHARHQLLYAASGVMHFEVKGRAAWSLPPQRAAWIPYGVVHRVRVTAPVALRTVYFRRSLASAGEASVFAVTPLAREMILEACRWGPNDRSLPDVARKLFIALAALAQEWRESGRTPFSLPVAETEELARAMRFILEREGRAPTIAQVARAAGLSERTLDRRFRNEARTSFRAFVISARMMRALELLALPGHRVTDVAVALGFASFGAFSTAFQRYTGETPSAYQKRIRGA